MNGLTLKHGKIVVSENLYFYILNLSILFLNFMVYNNVYFEGEELFDVYIVSLKVWKVLKLS